MPSSAAFGIACRPALAVERPAVRKFGAGVDGGEDSSERRFARRHVEHQRRAARPRCGERHRVVADRRLFGAFERHDGRAVLHHQRDQVRFGGDAGEMAERAEVSDVAHHDRDASLRACGFDAVLDGLQPAELSKTAVAVEVQNAGALLAGHSWGRVHRAALEQINIGGDPRHAVGVDTAKVGGRRGHLRWSAASAAERRRPTKICVDPSFQDVVRNNHVGLRTAQWSV